MPSVIILGRESRDDERAAFKLRRELGGTEQPLESEAEAFDPVFGGEVDAWEGCQATVSWGGGDEVVVWLCDWAGGFFDLTCEELVECGIVVGIWLHHLGERGLQLERLNERNDVLLAGGGIVLCAHLLALDFKQAEGFLPVQDVLLRAAVVEKVHSHAHINAHSFECLLPCLAIHDIVPKMELVLDGFYCAMGEVSGEPRVGFLRDGRAMNVRGRGLVFVLSTAG